MEDTPLVVEQKSNWILRIFAIILLIGASILYLSTSLCGMGSFTLPISCIILGAFSYSLPINLVLIISIFFIKGKKIPLISIAYILITWTSLFFYLHNEDKIKKQSNDVFVKALHEKSVKEYNEALRDYFDRGIKGNLEECRMYTVDRFPASVNPELAFLGDIWAILFDSCSSNNNTNHYYFNDAFDDRTITEALLKNGEPWANVSIIFGSLDGNEYYDKLKKITKVRAYIFPLTYASKVFNGGIKQEAIVKDVYEEESQTWIDFREYLANNK